MVKPEAGPGRKVKRKGTTQAGNKTSPWAQVRPHAAAAFDLDYYTSDACPNSKFLELLTKVLRTHRVHSMRSFLNALHSSNLVLQSKTDAFRLITGKDSKTHGEPELMAAMLHYARTDPAWMLKYGPAGDLPLHLAFLLGKRELGRDMLMALEELDADVLQAYWDQCYRLRARYPDTIDDIPAGRKDGRMLIRWIVNLPYQSDVLWWFKEVARRDQVGAAGHDELAKVFYNIVPKRHLSAVLENDTGLFTGETLIHIALQASDVQLVDWLIDHGANLDAKAAGLFFQPHQIPILPDNRSKWFWQDKVEDNTRAGCYYGGFPLSFAASIGDVQMASVLIEHATKVIEKHENEYSPFTAWLDLQISNLVERSEEFHEQFSGGSEVNKRRLAAFINVQDSFGNTALHMAVLYDKSDMIEHLIGNRATPSLSLMNYDHRTPLTLALRKADTFNLLLRCAFRETVWQYGDSEMTLLSLYQVDTFRVLDAKRDAEDGRPARALGASSGAGGKDKDASSSDAMGIASKNILDLASLPKNGGAPDRVPSSPAKLASESSMKLEEDKHASRVFFLHKHKDWKSALEIVVQHELHVLNQIPIFEQLIEAKWKAFARWHHLAYAIAPYLFFFVCFNAGLLLRCADVQAAFYNEDEYGDAVIEDLASLRRRGTGGKAPPSSGGEMDAGNTTEANIEWIGLTDFRQPGEVVLRVTLDAIVYILMVVWLSFKAWQDNKFLSATLDVNQDLNISWLEIYMYLYKNMGSILNFFIVILLVSAGCVRLNEADGWYTLPYVEQEEDSNQLSRELDILSVCCVLVWMNLLVLMQPYNKLGQLLLSIYSMLVGDVCRWVLIFLVFLGAFSLASYVAVVMSTKSVTDVFQNTLTSRQLSFSGLLLQFCYMSAGEVVPGTLSKIARNVDLINLYNLAFILLVTIVLVNLLVALMGSTFTRHSRLGRQMWWIEFADLVLRYESRLSKSAREMYRTGESMAVSSETGSGEHYLVAVNRKSDRNPFRCDDDEEEDDSEMWNQVDELASRMQAVQKDLAALTTLLRSQVAPGDATQVAHTDLAPASDSGVADNDGGQGEQKAMKTLQFGGTPDGAAALSSAKPSGMHVSLAPAGDGGAERHATSCAEALNITSDGEGSHAPPRLQVATPVSTRRAERRELRRRENQECNGKGEEGVVSTRRRRYRPDSALASGSAQGTAIEGEEKNPDANTPMSLLEPRHASPP